MYFNSANFTILIKKIIYEVKSERFKTVILSAGIWGLITHGMMFFNKYSWHDDMSGFNSIGIMYGLGRWMSGIHGAIVSFMLGTRHVSIPVVNGMLTIIFIALSVFLIIVGLNIYHKLSIVLLTGMMISFPAVTGMFGYMNAAPYYYFGVFISVLAAYLFHKNKGIIVMLLSSMMMACAIGCYQANIPICISALLLFFIEYIYKKDISWKDYLFLALKNVIVLLLSVVWYIWMNYLVLKFRRETLSEYKGINSFGYESIDQYFRRILLSYKEFFSPSKMEYDMFPYAAKYYRLALLFLSVVMIVLLLMLVANTSKSNVIYLIIPMLLMPCAAYFIFVMVDIDIIHGLMTYGEVMMYALLVWAVERFSDEMKSFNRLLFLRQLVYCLIGVILFSNIRFANLCYLKSNILQEQEISYFTSLITRIQQIEGYSDRLPVVYINEYEKHSDSFIGVDVFDVIDLVPYGVDEVINAYSWKKAMKVWCGFDPILGEEESFIENPEVKKMPCYPNDGSIKCIDNTIVVKFAE